MTWERNPIEYSFAALADSVASISRKLSRHVNCAKAMARNCSAHDCSAHDSVRTPESPAWRCTIRAKVVHGTNSMT